MSRELRIYPGVGRRKCGAFLSSLDRDPQPTCPRCRGKICTRDLTCDFCVGWSPAQWELFAKKRTYVERKRTRHSGFVPPAPKTSPRARTYSEVTLPGTTSSSSSLPSGGQVKRGESRGAPSVAPRETSSPPARPRSSEKGGSASGHSSGASERASVSSAPLGAAEGEVARLQRTPPARSASSVASPSSSQHRVTEVESQVSDHHSKPLSQVSPRRSRKYAVADDPLYASSQPVNPLSAQLAGAKTVGSKHWGSITFSEMERLERFFRNQLEVTSLPL